MEYIYSLLIVVAFSFYTWYVFKSSALSSEQKKKTGSKSKIINNKQNE